MLGCPVKRFVDLTEQEILALAITNEDEDSRIYRGFAEGLRLAADLVRAGRMLLAARHAPAHVAERLREIFAGVHDRAAGDREVTPRRDRLRAEAAAR